MTAKPIINHLDECVMDAEEEGSGHVVLALMPAEAASVRAALELAKAYHDRNLALRSGYDVLALQCEEECNVALSAWRESQEKIK